MSRACIPFHILFDQDLSKNELIIYGLIEHMESNGKPVFFNNRTIAEKLGVSHESRIVGKMLTRLKDKGYISREEKEVSFTDRKGGIKKEIRLCFNTVKSLVVSQESDADSDNPPLVPEVPPLPVPEIPSPPVPELPAYNTPDLNPPLTTTTQESSSSVFNEAIDKELLELQTKHLKNDERNPIIFLKQCKWHVDHGSKAHTFNQRVAGLKKIITSGCFDTPQGYPKNKEAKQQNDLLLWSHYQNYVKSPIEIGLRERGIAQLETFEIWKTKNA